MLVIAAYLGLTGWYFYRHLLGDTGGSPVAYFFVWDMFPNYVSESQQYTAIGKTRNGVYVRILPGPIEQFRWGADGEKTRVQIDRAGTYLRAAVNDALERTRPARRNDPVVHVYLVREYWPVRFNLSDALYEAEYGRPNPERRYWEVIDEYDLQAGEAAAKDDRT